MSPLTRQEQAELRELEAEVEKPDEPVGNDVRVERFIAEPVGMDDAGELFPIPESVDDA